VWLKKNSTDIIVVRTLKQLL